MVRVLFAWLALASFTLAADLSTDNDPILPGESIPGRPIPGASPTFCGTFPQLRGTSWYSKNVFLYRYLQMQIGEIEPHTQFTDGVGVGDCIGQACAMGADILACVNIHLLGKAETFPGKASVEMIFAGSRVEIGDVNSIVRPILGSTGYWAAEYMKQYGILHRRPYSDGVNYIDLRGYSAVRSLKYRNLGVPDWLEPIAKQHPIQEVTRVKTGREVLDAICSGQPVLICSSYAFHDTRDEQGFSAPYLKAMQYCEDCGRIHLFRKKWHHALIATGAIVRGGRVGVVLQNSMGNWNTGPRPYNMPAGSFAVDLKYIDQMVKDHGGDSWAMSAYKGSEVSKVNRRIRLSLGCKPCSKNNYAIAP